MPKSSSLRKTEIIATRVTSQIKDIIESEARREGLDISEWLRNLVIEELRKRGAFPRHVFTISEGRSE